MNQTQTHASRIIGAVQARGNDATNLRDAAHEACHALDYAVEGPWDRESIHDARPPERSSAIASEIRARAVERLVCERLGQPIENPDHWLFIAVMETTRDYGGSLPLAVWKSAVADAEKQPATLRLVDAVLALGEP